MSAYLTWNKSCIFILASALSPMPFPCSPGHLSTNVYHSLSSPTHFQTRLQSTLKFSFTQKLSRPSQFFINSLLNFYITCSHLVFIYIPPEECVFHTSKDYTVYIRLHPPPNLAQWFTCSPYSTWICKLIISNTLIYKFYIIRSN